MFQVTKLLACCFLQPCNMFIDLCLDCIIQCLSICIVCCTYFSSDGKTGWYRHTEVAHFSKVSALTTEEFAHCSIAFCELINVFLTSHYSLLNKSVVHYSLNTSLSQENVYILWCQTYENTFALTLQLIDTKENLFCPPKKA